MDVNQLVIILPTKNIRFKAPMLRSDMCDYSDAYFVANETINLKLLQIVT